MSKKLKYIIFYVLASLLLAGAFVLLYCKLYFEAGFSATESASMVLLIIACDFMVTGLIKLIAKFIG